ncbi:hypothetical protein ACET3Z_009195 [Daucus carota]
MNNADKIAVLTYCIGDKEWTANFVPCSNYNLVYCEENEYQSAAKDLLKTAKRAACHEDAPYNSFEALFDNSDQDGNNVLQLAVMGNNPDAVELILKKDPEYQHKRPNKNSDLRSLAYIAAEKGYKDIVKVVCTAYDLLERDPHLVTWEDHRDWTPLHYAAYYGFDAIKMEQNINNSVTEQGGLSGVGRIDQNRGGNTHMVVVAVDGGSGIAATGNGHVEGRENGGEEVGEGSSMGDNDGN